MSRGSSLARIMSSYFCIRPSVLATLKLGERLSVKYFVVLLAALLCLLGMRFYIFYMMLIAIGGAFVIGMRQLSTQRRGPSPTSNRSRCPSRNAAHRRPRSRPTP